MTDWNGFRLSGGDTTMTITLDDLRSYMIRKTLADEEIPQAGLILRAYVCEEVAKLWDVKPEHVELDVWDSMHVLIGRPGKEPLDAWEVEYLCHVWCDYCERIALHQTNFDANLCERHLDVAWEEHVADLENDDRAIGMQS